MAYVSFDAGRAGDRRPARATPVAFLPLLVGFALVATGIVRLSGLPWSEMSTALSARFWPVAEARILSASLAEVRAPAPGGAASELALAVEYEFEAEGTTVSATGASLVDRSGPEDRRLLTLYRRLEFARITGRTVPVAYDPDEPSRAFVDASLPWMDMLPAIAFGGACLLLGGHFLTRPAERRRSFRLPR